MENKSSTLPYPPSWMDRFTDWVETLPGPWWLFYVVASLVLVLVQSALQWQAGSYPIGTFNLFHVWFVLNITYTLALLHYLDKLAEAALNKSRPALDVNDAEYVNLSYRLTNSPARPMLVTSLIVTIASLPILPLLASGPAEILGFSSKPISLTILVFFWALTWWILGAFFINLPSNCD